MERQPSLGPETAPRPAPEGSVPAEGVEVVEDREDVSDQVSPVARDPRAAGRGGRLFEIDCAPCHGKDGRGGGIVSRKFPPAPDLRHVSICRRTDGFLYGTITAGGRAMPPMREGLRARDRWDLVARVREIQRGGCTGVAPSDATGEAP
jgi:mono/diheme cytochrome c family protein